MTKNSPKKPADSDDTAAIFAEIKRMHKEIGTKLDAIYRATGMNAKENSAFLESSTHFTPEKLELIKNKRKALRQLFLKKEEKPTKKPKRRASPRQKWIPMH